MRAGVTRANMVPNYMQMLTDAHERLERIEEALHDDVKYRRQRDARQKRDEIAIVRASGPDSGFSIIKEVGLLGMNVIAQRISVAPPPPFTIGTSQIYYLYYGNHADEPQPSPTAFAESVITDSLGFYSDAFKNELFIPSGNGLWFVNPVPQGIQVYVTLQVKRYRTYLDMISAEETYALEQGWDNYIQDEDTDDLDHSPEEPLLEDAAKIDMERVTPIQDERPQPHFAEGLTNSDILPMHGEEDLY